MEENGEENFYDSYEFQDSLGDRTPTEEQDFYDYEESLVRRKRQIGVYWKKPATKVYKDNFGFSVNGYQPMIDFLDAKDTGGSVKRGVHLPFLEERCLNRFSATKPVIFYDNRDIDKYIAKGEAIRTRIRQNDAAGASNVLRRTHTNWSMTKKYVQLVKNSYVIDYRKIPCDKGDSDDEEEPSPSYVVPTKTNIVPRTGHSLIPRFILADIDSAAMIATYIRNKIDHDHEMSARRDRLRALDDQYEETLRKLSHTVDRINRRTEGMPCIVSPHGNIYNPQDFADVADNLVHENRAKREQDLYRLSRTVNALTEGGESHLHGAGPSPYDMEAELYRVNPTIMAIARRNAEAAIRARNVGNLGLVTVTDDDDISDELRRRYLPKKSPHLELDDLPPTPRIKKDKSDLISDVQSRVINRAREIGGISAESLRISNRARYMNTVSPRPDTGAVDLRVPPSKTERNIVNMARSFAYTGKPIRRYDVDDEVDEPVSTPNTNITKTYCTREYERPVAQIPSDSNRARNAAIKARTRNTLLGN